MRDWEKIYQKRGVILREASPKIRRAVPTFRKHGMIHILDLGCGTGRHTIFLASKGFSVVGLDSSGTALRLARRELKKSGVVGADFRLGDMKSIPYTNGCFDAVVCTGVLPHGRLMDIERTVGEIHRVLRRGGYLITDTMSTRDPDFGQGMEIEPNTFIGLEEEEDVPHHYFTKEGMLRLLSEFKILQLYHKTARLYYKKRKNRAAQWHVVAVK